MIIASLVWLLCGDVSPNHPATALQVDARVVTSGIEVTVGDKPFLTLNEGVGRIPYCWPVVGPNGAIVTRGYPMKHSAGEARDHPHHQSLWFAHGNVNGHDFWHGAENRIVPITRSSVKREGSNVVIESHYRWTAVDTPMLEEKRRVTLSATSRQRTLDFEIRLRPTSKAVRFGDTKEGSFAMRLHPALRLKGEVAGGHARTSTGVTGPSVWGKRASWIEYWGPIDGKPTSVALFDHPLNLRYPTWWHARTYGLVAANPFGIHDFESKPAGTGDWVLDENSERVFRYRVVITDGEVDVTSTTTHWSSWSAPAVTVDLAGGVRQFFSTTEAWSVEDRGADGHSLILGEGGTYNPPHRSPGRIALLNTHAFGDFTAEFDAKQTGREYGHRDLCFFFGVRDAANYYYVHLATKPDDHACNVFLVDDAPRRRLAKVPAKGVDWGENAWHRIRVVRSGGSIRVYYDDLDTPILQAEDATHGVGLVGFGSFDDTGEFKNIRLWSQSTTPPVTTSPF